jgi:hypothetical protein
VLTMDAEAVVATGDGRALSWREGASYRALGGPGWYDKAF